jgi:hypothetical protein
MNITEVRKEVGTQSEVRLQAVMTTLSDLKYAYASASVDLGSARRGLSETIALLDSLESLEKKFSALEVETKMLLDIKDPAITESVAKPAPSIVPDDIAF